MNDGTPSPLSVLVVDDLPDAARMTAAVLSLHGYVVRTAGCGEAALRAVAADPPDVVLLDINLPDISGWEVVRRLRDRAVDGKQPVVIAVTGYGQDRDRLASTLAGIDQHLVKPVDPTVLLAQLERFCRILGRAAGCNGAPRG